MRRASDSHRDLIPFTKLVGFVVVVARASVSGIVNMIVVVVVGIFPSPLCIFLAPFGFL